MRKALVISAISIPFILLVGVAGAYVFDEVVSAHEVSRGVTADGVSISRMTQPEAAEVVQGLEEELQATPLALVVDEVDVTLDPKEVDLDLDEYAVVDQGITVNRSDSLWENIEGWLTSWIRQTEAELPVTVDLEALEAALDDLTRSTIDDPAFEGAVRVEDGVAVAEYPVAGLAIDTEASLPLILEALSTRDRSPVVLPLMPLEPTVDDGDVDAAVELAEQLIADQVVLRSASDAGFLVFTKTMLANALVSDARDGEIKLSFDPERITPIVMQRADEFAVEAVDASFEFDQETKEFSILESSPARTVDLEAVPQAVYDAAVIGLNGLIPMVDAAEPEFTTLDAQAMGELGEVASYTTYHPCCANRVINIQTIAKAVDGAIVMPGETFSVNEHVGQRTRAKGYVPAGAIIGGRIECCDSPINIGGGTSQFATTLWNAIFFGCYEDVTHTPHSIYFDRYPFIREATLGFPSPDVAFTNDSDAVLAIDTSWTSGSITVSIYGNNGGRTCESETSGNTNTRIMTHPDGSVSTETWTWNYRKELPPETVPTTAPASTTSTEVTSTTAAPTTTEATTTTTAEGGGETP